MKVALFRFDSGPFLGKLSAIHRSWRLLFNALRSLNRRAELKRLICWAERRHFVGPQNFYESLLRTEEQRLMLFRMRYPGQLFAAQLLHTISNIVSPTPRHFHRGAASTYRDKYMQRNKQARGRRSRKGAYAG